MNKRQFLFKMFEYFELSDSQIEQQLIRYSNGLKNNINYDKMYNFIALNASLMPTAIEINSIADEYDYFYLSAQTPLEHMREIKNTPRINFKTDISPEFRQKLLNFHKKYGIKTKIKELQNEG